MKTECSFSDSMVTIKEIVDENFQDYKKASMFIASCRCDFKCLMELGLECSICQNMGVSKMPDKKISASEIFKRYMCNPITQSIVIGGLEPMLQFDEFLGLISYFRSNGVPDDFVIYTGYNEDEIKKEVQNLKKFDNIIIKYGRFIPNSKPVYSDVLGITLSSENQYALKIS